jgi:geranylgeranyl diphosphate synthase, type II
MARSSTSVTTSISTAQTRQLERWKIRFEQELDRALPSADTRPVLLHEAMRYTVFNGGKRLRPLLALAAAEACGGFPSRVWPAACALELVHTYSLVHDDLPCMDDDDLRRGRPTCHIVYGEALAVLTGDALLTEAFAILARQRPTPRYPAARFVRELAAAAGSRFLIAGQVADMEAEGQPLANQTREGLRFIHRGKTAAMIVASLRLGAMSANATPTRLEHLSQFGWNLGLAFQVIDDILDCTQTSEVLGKSAGKDIAAGKATYPALLGLSAAKKQAARLTREAISSLDPLGSSGELLRHLATKLLQRSF